jgi:hypothetical protein
VLVGKDDYARYLGLAEHAGQDSNRYVIKLGVIRSDNEIEIASSLPFHLPPLSENETITGMGSNQLLRLSGVQDLSVTRRTDRQSRIKRQQ